MLQSRLFRSTTQKIEGINLVKKFIIITDSCSDLPQKYLNKYNIKFVPLTYLLAGKEFKDDFGKSVSYEDFYTAMKAGKDLKTSQANPQAFYDTFIEHVKEATEILYIGVSTGLSGTFNSANIARKNILDEYPNAKITLINALTASMGQGLLVIKALEMQEQGKTLSEIVKYLQAKIRTLKTFMTVNDLKYLKKVEELAICNIL